MFVHDIESFLAANHVTTVRKAFSIFLALFILQKIVFFVLQLRKIALRKRQTPFPNVAHPPVPNPHWYFGHLKAVGGDQRIICVDHANPKTGVSTFWTLYRPVVSFLRAKDVLLVMRYSYDREPIPIFTKHYKRLLGNNSLVMTYGKDWMRNRRIVHRAFSSGALRDAQAAMTVVSKRFVQSMLCAVDNSNRDLQHGKAGGFTTDVVELTKMATLDVFGLAALGHDFHCTSDNKLEQSPLAEIFSFLSRDMTRRCYTDTFHPAAQHYWIPTLTNFKFWWNDRRLRCILKDIIVRRKVQDSGNGGNRNSKNDSLLNYRDGVGTVRTKKVSIRLDLLGHLCEESNNETSKYLTADYMTDFMITLLFGGYDTASLTLSYALYCLSHHRDAEDKCAQEALIVLGQNENVQYNNDSQEELSVEEELPYCTAVILETLRLYPPVRNAVRDLGRSVEIENDDGTFAEIPKGTRVIASFWWIHRHEENFVRAEEFIPERWVRRRKRHSLDAKAIKKKTRSISPWEYRDAAKEERELKEAKTFSVDRVSGGEETKECEIPAADKVNLLSFSAGGRSCIGQRFAMQQVPSILAYLIKDVTMKVDPHYELELERLGPNQSPKGGLPMTFYRRRHIN